MADIQFEGEQEFARPPAASGRAGLTALVIKWGLTKDEKTARYVLLGVAAAAIILAIALPSFFGSDGGQKPAYYPPDAAAGIPGR